MRRLKLLMLGVLVSTPHTALAEDGTWNCWYLRDGQRVQGAEVRVVVSNGKVLETGPYGKKIPPSVIDLGDEVTWIYEDKTEWTLDIKASKLSVTSAIARAYPLVRDCERIN